MHSDLDNVEKEEFETLLKTYDSVKLILESLGLQGHGANYKTFWRRLVDLGFDVAVVKSQLAASYKARTDLRGRIPAIPLADILVANRRYSSRDLKRRLVKEGLLTDTCSECGIGSIWNR